MSDDYDDDTAEFCGEHTVPRTDCECRLPGFAGTILTRSQLASVPPIRPMIAGVLSRPSAAVLVGSYGIGKTFLSLSMAASIATGTDWLGHTVEAAPVLYIIGEGASGMDARVTAWESEYHDGRPIADDRLLISVRPGSLSEGSTWSQLRNLARDTGCRAVFADTLSSLAPDADETRDAAKIMRQLSDTASAIDGPAVLVHHPGWSDNGRVRGGYQLEANADEVLVLTGTPTEPLLTLTVKKRKDGTSGERLWLRRQECADSVVIATASASDAGLPHRDRLVVVLDNYGAEGCTGSHLLTELDASGQQRSGIYKALGQLQSEGVITKEFAKRGGRYWLREHTPDGVQLAAGGRP